MPNTVFIIDAYFQGNAGHNAIYNGEVLAACIRRGVPCRVLAAENIAQDCGAGTLPFLSSPTEFPLSSLFRRYRPLTLFWKLPFCNVRRFLELLIRLRPLVPEESTALITDMSPSTFLGDCCFWGLMGILRRRATIIAVLHDRPGKWFYFVSWLAAKLLLRQKLVLGFQPESLLSLRSSLSPIPNAVHLPLPQVHSMLGSSAPQNAPTRSEIIISCVGLTKRAKGTDVMLGALEIFMSRPPSTCASNLAFLIQIDRQELATFAGASYCQAVDRLSQYPQVKFVEGSVSSGDYARMIQASDCVVLPYRAEFYRYIQSSVFLEAIAAGKVVIVPSGTAMAKDSTKHSLGLIFESGNAESLAHAMGEMLKTIDSRLAAVRINGSALLAKHDIDRYVDILVGSAKQNVE